MVYATMALTFKIDEGRVYGARYYTAEPHCDDWGEAVPWYILQDWVEEMFGESKGSIWFDRKSPDPGERWYVNNAKFWFRNKEDLEWFLLRWQ